MEINKYREYVCKKILKEGIEDIYTEPGTDNLPVDNTTKKEILNILEDFIFECEERSQMYNNNEKEIWFQFISKLEGLKESYNTLNESRCKGPTKKASSTRKGKKWMQCVSDGKGGHKRVHWGQKGVKVTGKSGDTKRKKSFRARHNCKNAKKGTPQYQACKDW